MAGTTFVDKSTVIQASWLQSINDFFYNLFQASTTVQQARAALGIGSSSVFTESTTSRTLDLDDAEAYIICTNGSATTVTIPSGVFSAPTTIVVAQQGAGQVTIAAGVGVTLNCAGTPSTRAQYSVLGIMQTSTNTFYVTGDFVTA